MNRINKVLLLLTASAGVSFALLNAQDVSQASTQVSQSKTSTTAPLPNNRLALKADAPVVAAQYDDSGTIGDNVTWKIEGTTLTISGGTIGEHDPEMFNGYPWYGQPITNVIITGKLNLTGNAPEQFFFGLANLRNIQGFYNLDLSQATSTNKMFFKTGDVSNLDFSHLNTGNVTNMSEMFSNSNFTKLNLSGLDTQSVTNMADMFSNSPLLTTVDLTNLNTKKVENMSQMFFSDNSLTDINLTGVDTSSATDMSAMFANDPALKELDFSKFPSFNTSNVQFMNDMFAVDPSLAKLNVSTFNTDNVVDMHNMFAQDSALTSLDLTKWNTKNVKNMSTMFAQMDALTSLDLSNFNTANVQDMNGMFLADTSLKSLDVSNFNTSKVKNMSGMFLGNIQLPVLNVSSFNTANVTDASAMFGHDTALTSLDISSFDLLNAGEITDMLGELTSLKRLTLGENTMLTSIAGDYPTKASLGKPNGGEQWQAVDASKGGTITHPVGNTFTPDELMGLYSKTQTRPTKETYVLPGLTDQSAINVIPTITIPINSNFDPAKVFISAITPEGSSVTKYVDATAAGMMVSGANFDTSKPGQHKVTFNFAGSDKTATTIVTVYTPGGGGGGGNITPNPTPTPTPTHTPTPQPQPTPTPTPTPNPPTTPGYVTKKKAAVYALKAIYLYKNPTFKKSQRIATYPKQKRVNRPMFVVIGYARSNNGTFRYKVRDVNHGRKSDGKIGYITANWKFVRGVYYQSVPKNKVITVISKKGVHAYKNKNLTGRVKSYKKGTRLTVKKLVKHNLTTRYQLSNGMFVTANKKLVIQGKY
ncbi:BspA family leucine-rich repeat surface protein [Lentilactobacillus sp.]|uniref:BspA family leucine-rich repeat surface protein n=1 Tax=Lentilactobacillus sp. TaxID=2767931 RepID=UPI00345E70A4